MSACVCNVSRCWTCGDGVATTSDLTHWKTAPKFKTVNNVYDNGKETGQLQANRRQDRQTDALSQLVTSCVVRALIRVSVCVCVYAEGWERSKTVIQR